MKNFRTIQLCRDCDGKSAHNCRCCKIRKNEHAAWKLNKNANTGITTLTVVSSVSELHVKLDPYKFSPDGEIRVKTNDTEVYVEYLPLDGSALTIAVLPH